jgi:hypothetical protein
VITNTINAVHEVASHTVRRRGGSRRKRAINWARRRRMARVSFQMAWRWPATCMGRVFRWRQTMGECSSDTPPKRDDGFGLDE